MIKGSCLCRSVRWEVDGPLGDMSHCHCTTCRKHHGAAFATYVSAEIADYRLVSGADLIRKPNFWPRIDRAFCATCGSVVPMIIDGKAVIPAGCLDDDPGIRPAMHIFVASMAPWHAITDDLPQHDAYPAESGLPESPMGPRHEDPSEHVRGSCLCNAIAFELSAPFTVVHNCHCSRCRKARAAAHTTNGFLPIEAIKFLRGEDLVATYKVPEADAFTHAFCSKCGSGVPRLRPDSATAMVPLGSLDDDPGQGADDHIFTGSKSPWYEITDDLPQFEEYPTS